MDYVCSLFRDKPFGEQEALIRDSRQMLKFINHFNSTATTIPTNAPTTTTTIPTPTTTNAPTTGSESQEKQSSQHQHQVENISYFFPEFFPMTNIPYFHSMQLANHQVESPTFLTIAPEGNPIMKNIDIEKDIRRLRAFIEIDMSKKSDEGKVADVQQYEELHIKDVSMEAEPSPSEVSYPINEEFSRSLLKKAVMTLLAHSGFEASNSICVDLLMDIMAQFYLNFGHVFRCYADLYGNKMAPDELLQRSLSQMGVTGTNTLEEYWKCDVLHFTHKLNDAKRKLKRKHKELTGGNLTQGDADFDDEGIETDIALLSGNFGGIDLDVLGLKELGIDIQVPASLLRPGVKSKFVAEKTEQAPETVAKMAAPVPSRLPPIPDPSQTIGLLTDFLNSLIQKDTEIKEDIEITPDQKHERRLASLETDQNEIDEAKKESTSGKAASKKPTGRPPKKKHKEKEDKGAEG